MFIEKICIFCSLYSNKTIIIIIIKLVHCLPHYFNTNQRSSENHPIVIAELGRKQRSK